MAVARIRYPLAITENLLPRPFVVSSHSVDLNHATFRPIYRKIAQGVTHVCLYLSSLLRAAPWSRL